MGLRIYPFANGKRYRRGTSNIWSNGLWKVKAQICPERKNIKDVKKRMEERKGDQSLFEAWNFSFCINLWFGPRGRNLFDCHHYPLDPNPSNADGFLPERQGGSLPRESSFLILAGWKSICGCHHGLPLVWPWSLRRDSNHRTAHKERLIEAEA